MCADGGYAKGLEMIPSPGGKVDHGDHGDTWGGQGVGITPSRGGSGRRRTSSHWRVHQEAAGNHTGKGGLLSRL